MSNAETLACPWCLLSLVSSNFVTAKVAHSPRENGTFATSKHSIRVMKT